ncbi:hypothetical protein EZ313_03040 [Ramlibacter henchirensis]|uniref:Uncharacterized protein n=1 Tax=Ramlibacter henchirensis TaxID=204072 RepID=A0A4Z0C463_9BURK|nr:hypothetical protein [Ramlibacter henchirensis]TFZ05654.1 hypothetical protein EZ313_03040 [Ramlibacter henchirensis]
MMEEFAVQLRQWRGLELDALRAEDVVKGMQAANSLEFAKLARNAAEKRRAADDFFGLIWPAPA